MSNEITTKATEAKETKEAAEAKNAEEATEKKKGKGKIIIAAVLTLILLTGAGVGFHFYWQGANYIVTDNARVTTNLIAVVPPVTGILERFMIYEGRYVAENEILGWVENGEAMRSPVDGLVVHSSAVQNQVVSPHEPVAVIADVNNLHIQANIEETDIAKIQVGQAVTVTIDPLGNREFTGYVSEIGRITAAELSGQAMFFNTGGTFTRVTHLIPIKIKIVDDINLDNFIGVNARVRIPLKASESGFPPESGIADGGAATHGERRDVFAAPGFLVEWIFVEVGDYVTEGQILCELDTEELSLAIEQQRAALEMARQSSQVISAETSLRVAEINLADAEHNYETLRTLYDAGAVSQDDLRQSEILLQSARTSHRNARALLSAARAEGSANVRHMEISLQILENQLEDAIIKAPVSGVVTAVFAREGAVSPGVLFVIEKR